MHVLSAFFALSMLSFISLSLSQLLSAEFGDFRAHVRLYSVVQTVVHAMAETSARSAAMHHNKQTAVTTVIFKGTMITQKSKWGWDHYASAMITRINTIYLSTRKAPTGNHVFQNFTGRRNT